jgi:hypothetical protein
MKLAENIPMVDQQGNEVTGIGVVSEAGTCVASATVRKNPSLSWSRPNSSGNVSRTIAFGDVSLQMFRQTSEPDENGFVTGEMVEDGIMLRHTPFYIMQIKKNSDPDSRAEEPFINSIADYVYRQNDRANTRNQKIPMHIIYGGEERKELIVASINKACEILNDLDQAGVAVPTARKNNLFAQGASAILNMVGRQTSDQQSQGNNQQQVSNTMSADDVIPN